MTIQEITDLRNEEIKNNLRLPKNAENIVNTQELIEVNRAIQYLMRDDKRNLLLVVDYL